MQLRLGVGAAVLGSLLSAVAILSLASAPGCGSSRSGSYSQGVGPAGGVVAGVGSLAGFSVTFPPGAVSSFTTVTVSDGSNVPAIRSLRVGPAYHVDAGGVAFSASVTVTVPYDPSVLYGSFPGASEAQLSSSSERTRPERSRGGSPPRSTP